MPGASASFWAEWFKCRVSGHGAALVHKPEIIKGGLNQSISRGITSGITNGNNHGYNFGRSQGVSTRAVAIAITRSITGGTARGFIN